MAPVLGIWASSFNSRTFQPTGSYDALASYTVGSSGVSTITFAGLPAGEQYAHLQIRLLGRDGRSDGVRADAFQVNFNGDFGSNYSYHALYGNGSSAGSFAGTSSSTIYLYTVTTNSANSNTFGACIIDILDYENTNKYKTVKSLGGNSDSTTTNPNIMLCSGSWRNTAAINNITITSNVGNFQEYSQFALYGVKG